MAHVGVGAATIEIQTSWIVGPTIARTRAAGADAAGRIVDRVRPGIRRQDRQASHESLLEFTLQRIGR